ncbi:DUF3581 domain-containing protein [Psychromonas sp. psych-6C06]|uniref:DUF3581 family protein n=1 Tax=Psychromonas sp. psych-6C06 TaxID=2058089 RepID=UPI000C33F3CE|nr:DUF3581 family protein [Psychromonas sp. psych-6C06]PKF60393.1 DUF3581 domain-containing protein [Psychromonas sp. psych-6C06]
MLLTPFYTTKDNLISVSATQASDFAKLQCFDFNPIHDPDNKRFCVPGDLLFSLALHTYGVSESMSFTFTNMVGADMALNFPETDENSIVITNAQGKSVLEIERKGKINRDSHFVESLIKNYGQFSGQNFPTLLMPLMKEHDVMFNPNRPLVMYNSMSFEFESVDFEQSMRLELADSTLEVEPKRANSYLHFDIFDGDKLSGKGIKKLVIAGLKPYDEEVITEFVKGYEARRDAF